MLLHATLRLPWRDSMHKQQGEHSNKYSQKLSAEGRTQCCLKHYQSSPCQAAD